MDSSTFPLRSDISRLRSVLRAWCSEGQWHLCVPERGCSQRYWGIGATAAPSSLPCSLRAHPIPHPSSPTSLSALLPNVRPSPLPCSSTWFPKHCSLQSLLLLSRFTVMGHWEPLDWDQMCISSEFLLAKYDMPFVKVLNSSV